MIARRTAPSQFEVVFENEEELRAEHAANLANGGLRLPTEEKVAPFTPVSLTLRLEGRGEATVKATVVAPLPGALALATEGNADALLAALLALPAPPVEVEAVEKDQSTVWDRLRALSPLEKRMLAPKAERQERMLLTQDNDPQVLFGLLKNPRITVDEVVRVAKSPYLSYQTAELMMKNTQWLANLDLRVTLIHNPKTPPPFAMRILPTLPESEVRNIARGAATSMALKTAALKKLQAG